MRAGARISLSAISNGEGCLRVEAIILALVIAIGACVLIVCLHKFPTVLTFRFERQDNPEFMEALETEKDKQKKVRDARYT